MNKYYDFIMWVLTCTCVGIVLYVLAGCANTQMVEEARLDTEYRKSLLEYKEPRYEPKGTGPIEMPQEWLDQWPSTKQVNEQIENSVIGVHQ